ncbi:MAG: response regulator [Chitinivibrionales bacterium]|nr:response regulator [Chitinivibrionales bacterium]
MPMPTINLFIFNKLPGYAVIRMRKIGSPAEKKSLPRQVNPHPYKFVACAITTSSTIFVESRAERQQRLYPEGDRVTDTHLNRKDGYMAVRVLIADDDLDTHQFLHDIIEINFKDVKIERALSHKIFIEKISTAEDPYNLILLDYYLEGDNGEDIISLIQKNKYQDVLERTVLMNPTENGDERIKNIAQIKKPFSLDDFSNIIKQVCVEN